ncbi:hypothetical protein WDU94_015538 [Cyamophila willieti]
MSEKCAPCLNLPGYVNTASYFRDDKKGGGVSLYTRDNLDFSPLSLDIAPVLLSFEYTAIKSPSLETAIIGIYRSNNVKSDINIFFDCLDLVLQKVVSFKYIFVCSDTNVDLHKDTNDRLRLFSILNLYNLKPSVFTPTRVTSTTSTCIDNIFINFPPRLLVNSNLNNIFSGIGDHKHGQVIKFNIDKSTRIEKIYKRSFSPNQISAFLDSLSQADFSQIYQLPLVDDQLSFFYDTFLLLFNSHFPYKTASVGRKRRKEWITKGIRVSSENKRSLFNLSLHTSDPSFLSYYHTYCRILKKVVKEAKGSYTVQQIKRAPKQKKIKTIWNVIKSHSKYNKKATADPFKIKIGNTQIQNPIAVANTFNNFWINVAKEIINSQSTSSSSSSHTRLSSSNHSSSSSSLPPTSSPNFSTPSTSSYSSSAFLPPSNLSPTLPPPSSSYPTLPPSFTLAPCSPIEILKIVGGLQNKTSCGEDDIPMTVIKKVIHVIAGPLSFIFNSSFSTSTFPKLFKNAIITPVHKGKGAMTDLNSFRPISLLNNFAKILEKLVAYRISTYLEHHNLLVEQQFGFRHGRSTSDAVAHFIQKLDIILASGQQAIGIFCDLTKAFDCVDHALLLSKLPTFGIRGTALLWIQSYLSNRQQKVKVPSCSAPSVTPNTTLNTSSSTSLLNSNLPPSPTHPSPSLPLPSSVHLNHQFSSVSPYHVSRSTSQPALSIPSSPVPTTSILPITSHSLPNIPPPNNSPRLPYISSQPYSQYMFPCVAQYSPNPPHPFPPSLTTSSPLIPPLTSKPNSPSVSTSTPFHPPAAAY